MITIDANARPTEPTLAAALVVLAAIKDALYELEALAGDSSLSVVREDDAHLLSTLLFAARRYADRVAEDVAESSDLAELKEAAEVAS